MSKMKKLIDFEKKTIGNLYDLREVSYGRSSGLYWCKNYYNGRFLEVFIYTIYNTLVEIMKQQEEKKPKPSQIQQKLMQLFGSPDQGANDNPGGVALDDLMKKM